MSDRDPEVIDQSASIRHKLLDDETSTWKRYAGLVNGNTSILQLLKYEFITCVFGHLPGALGLALRKIFYPFLFRKVGRGVVFGRGLTIRNADRVSIGDRVMIDDQTLIDARGAGDEGIVIGDSSVLNREVVLVSKAGAITIGTNTDIGRRSSLISTGGIRVGNEVKMAGDCKIGGSSVQPADDGNAGQKTTDGPVVIGDRSILFMSATLLDGVEIHADSVIGANLIIRDDVPENTTVAAHQRLVYLSNDPAAREQPKPTADEAPPVAAPTTADAGAPGESDESGEIVDAVYAAIGELNRMRPADSRFALELDTDLSSMSSMDLVSLIVQTEQELEEQLGLKVNLADPASGGLETFSSVRLYVRRIEAAVAEQRG